MTLAEADHPIAQRLSVINDAFSFIGSSTDVVDRYLPGNLAVVYEAPVNSNDFTTKIRVANLLHLVLSLSDLEVPNRDQSMGSVLTISGSDIPVLAKITTINLLGAEFKVYIGPNEVTTPKVEFLILADGVAMGAIDEYGDSKNFIAVPDTKDYEQVYSQVRRLAALEQLNDTSLKLGEIELAFEEFDFDK